MDDQFLDSLAEKYPNDSKRFETELESLKRKLNEENSNEETKRSPCKKHKSDVKGCSNYSKVKSCIYTCNQCGKMFSRKFYLKRHVLSHEKRFSCSICAETYSRQDNLTRHRKFKHVNSDSMQVQLKQDRTGFKCSYCVKTFSRRDNLNRHIKIHHSRSQLRNFQCNHCDYIFSSYPKLIKHVEDNHPFIKNQTGGRLPNDDNTSADSYETKQQKKKTKNMNKDESVKDARKEKEVSQESALNDGVKNKIIFPENEDVYDLLSFFANSRGAIRDFLQSQLQKHGIKWYLSTQVEMYKETPDEAILTDKPYFRSLTYATLSSETLSEHELNESFQKMSASLESYLRNASGWSIKKVLHLKVHTVIYKPLTGSSYIELPLSLKKSCSVLNVRNDDEKCFAWSILASLHPIDSHPAAVEHYTAYESELNMNGIDYPVPLSKIDKFERQNHNISINVFAFEKNEILPLRVTKHAGRDHHIDLLLLRNIHTSHYCLIKDLNKFLFRTKPRKCKTYFCPYCLHGFVSEKVLSNHKPYCSIHGPQKVELPISGKNDTLEFSDYEKQLKIPFVIYADFECLNVKVEACASNPQQSHTTTTSLLQPISFGYKVVCQNPKYTKPTVIYRGTDASQKLIECLLKAKQEIDTILENVEPIRMSVEEEEALETATHCCICNKAFGPNDKIVRHHQHFLVSECQETQNDSNFIGPAHNRCNLMAKKVSFIPCIFHNLKHFDGHILMQSLGLFKDNQIKCIPSNSQNYISFSIDKLRFIDSFQFLNSSLENLVENLASDSADSFQYFKKEFSHQHSELLLRKGIYPYEYIDSESRFEETELPPIESFYSQIKAETISQSEYAHALAVYRTFGLKNLGEYHDLYLRTDVVLLCDVFEQFRNVCLEQYGLDPCHYYTSPGLSWSACLKKSGVCLELLCDIDQLNFIERGMRGGISQISHRYQSANNPILGEEEYDSNEPTSYIQYLDMNNLYGYAMTQKLPTGMFRFLKEDEIEGLDILSIPENGSTGYILEVSLVYPKALHNEHADYPLAPEKRRIKDEELSPYAKKLWKKLNGLKDTDKIPPRASVEKLITSLDDKNNYVLHYRNLQLYLRLGMEIKKTHRVLEFYQEAWMKSYIDFNTEERKKAKSAFQKNFYKLMNCSVFGKTMENVRKHVDVRLVQTKKKLQSLSSKPTFKGCIVFSENLVAVEMKRAKVKLFKPSYSGMCMLDLSKYAMYDFYYNYLKAKYQNRMRLLMSDTDSLLFWCQTDNIYQDMDANLALFDTSDYKKDHFLYSDRNKKKVGVMKDETAGVPIREFVGIRSKMYSFVFGSHEEKKLKGISKAVVRNEMTLEMYKATLNDEKSRLSSMTLIRSHAHQLSCEKLNKVSLSPFDDKRYLLDSIHSLPYGHYKLEELQHT